VETALDLHWSSTADDLFECCDAVSIHTVDAEVVSAKRLQDPGRCRVLVNTARTSAWDEAAVIEAARRGRLSVGTDCVESKAWADESLRDRVIVTPHVAGDSLMRVAREFESVAIACLEPAGSNQSHILGGENLEV
jgi:lactate dehydrogenase-like 2-hydroxyacid dehydrogenase